MWRKKIYNELQEEMEMASIIIKRQRLGHVVRRKDDDMSSSRVETYEKRNLRTT